MPADPDEGRLAVVADRHPLAWAPRSLTRPEVDPALTALPPVERAAEVLRYSAAKFEYWISPGGHLREVVRLSILLAALLALPVLMVMPLVTLFLAQIAGWTDLIVKILLNIAAIAFGIALASILLRMFAKKPNA